jgi:hypothetical protein
MKKFYEELIPRRTVLFIHVYLTYLRNSDVTSCSIDFYSFLIPSSDFQAYIYHHQLNFCCAADGHWLLGSQLKDPICIQGSSVEWWMYYVTCNGEQWPWLA